MADNLGELWKKGTTPPLASDLVEGGLGIDVFNKKAYSKANDGTVFQITGVEEGHTHEISDVDGLQDALDSKEPDLGKPDTNGKILSSNVSGDRSWITPPQGVTEHNLLSGRSENDSHPITAVTNLQSTLDGKSDSNHNHDATYVKKSGDTMTGNLIISNASPGIEFTDTDQGSHFDIKLHPVDVRFQTGKDNFIFEGMGGQSLTGDIYIRKNGVTYSFYNSGNDGAGSGLDADMLDGMQPNALPVSTPMQNALDDKMDISEGYLRTQFINTSTGSDDAGKPIVLDGDGKIDDSMLDIIGGWTNQGAWTPTAGTEYPDVSDPGATPSGSFWSVVGVDDTDGYEFTTGELAGETAYNGNLMVWAGGAWSIKVSELNPLEYYKLDGSQSISANFAGGGYKIANIAAANANGEAVEFGQYTTALNGKSDTGHGHAISDVTDLQSTLDLKLESSDLDNALIIGSY